MAALPLDPPIARMVIAAKAEGCQREIAIIAAGLSIVDPRERPMAKKQEADEAHKRFTHSGSDFLTLLKLWDAYQSEWEQLKTQNALRRFCRNHFLSYTRMREWHDIHEQIRQGLRAGRRHETAEPAKEPHPDAIHRCILAGLVTNVAMKRVEKDGYAAPRNREVFIFPGSTLSKKQPPWLVCHEIVETSRVFARTVGPIDPQWIEQLAPDLCRANYGEPFFEPASGAVRARETVSFYGLPIVKNRLVDYRRIDAARAHEVFVREALVGQQLLTHRPFLTHNREQREKAAALEDKLRQRGIVADDDALFDFYHQRLMDITSSRDLERLIRDRGGDRFLYMRESDVIMPQSAPAEEFPDTLLVGGANYSLKYAFNPGGENDGVTIEIPATEAPFVPQNLFGWLVPPLWPAKIATLLRALPKNVRKTFVPIPDSAARLAARLQYAPRPFTDALAEAVRELFSVELDPALLNEVELPQHLQMRIELTDDEGKTVRAARGLLNSGSSQNSNIYREWPAHVLERVRSLERRDSDTWAFGEIPAAILLSEPGEGILMQGYPALTANNRGSVDYLLYPTEEDAKAAHLRGVVRLCELRLAEQLAWLEKDLKLPAQLKLACSPFGGAEVVCRNIAAAIRRHILTIDTALPMSKDAFDATIGSMATQLRGIAAEAIGLLDRSLSAWGGCRRLLEKMGARHTSKVYVELRGELGEDLQELMNMIVAPDLLFARCRQLPRSLTAFALRIERAFLDISKHRERMNQLTPFVNKAREAVRRHPEFTPELQRQADAFRQMVDEYAIALFAHPNVRTLCPVSEKRLEKLWMEVKSGFS
jgi:ATP-dependent helicase HrpA